MTSVHTDLNPDAPLPVPIVPGIMLGTTGQVRWMAHNSQGRIRCPHHTVSGYGLLQEWFMACCGVLYLDEPHEIKRGTWKSVIGSLRLIDPIVRRLGCPRTVVFGQPTIRKGGPRAEIDDDSTERARDRVEEMIEDLRSLDCWG